MKKIIVNLKDESYPIFIQRSLLKQEFIFEQIKDLASSFVIITHDSLVELYGKELLKTFSKDNKKSFLFSFKEKEINKSRKTLFNLQESLVNNALSKDICIIALGGGIVSDLAGFLASTYCRGVPLVNIPTTLLAIVDASIGGKNGINSSLVKNIMGTFYHPKAIFVDFDLLDTLSHFEYQNGLVELIKHSLIADREEFYKIRDENITDEKIINSILIKKKIIEKDVNDRNIRKVLNFGHTIGHAIETLSNYKISHGKAVALGIIIESYISKEMNSLSLVEFNEILDLFRSLDLIVSFPKISFEKIKDVMILDKKNINGQFSFSLIEKIGKGVINIKVNDLIIKKALLWAQENLNACCCYNRA